MCSLCGFVSLLVDWVVLACFGFGRVFASWLSACVFVPPVRGGLIFPHSFVVFSPFCCCFLLVVPALVTYSRHVATNEGRELCLQVCVVLLLSPPRPYWCRRFGVARRLQALVSRALLLNCLASERRCSSKLVRPLVCMASWCDAPHLESKGLVGVSH